MRRALLVLFAAGSVALATAVAARSAQAPSFASEQLAGSLADDNWEPTTAADPHAPWIYQAVTAINDQCASHDCSIYSILVRASSDDGVTWGPFVPVCGIVCMWSSPVRLSNLASGAPYKSATGYTFPFGDYLGLAVDSGGTNHVIWGEGNGIYTGHDTGGSWFTRGG